MKTIRENTFETNSSSTHAYSVSVPAGGAGYKPIVSGPVNLKQGNYWYGDGQSWSSRIQLMYQYLGVTGRLGEFDAISEAISTFIGQPLVVESENKFADIGDYADLKEYVRDEFYKFCNEDYSDGVEGFISSMNAIVGDVNKAVAFAFTEGIVDQHEYYDG